MTLSSSEKNRTDFQPLSFLRGTAVSAVKKLIKHGEHGDHFGELHCLRLVCFFILFFTGETPVPQKAQIAQSDLRVLRGDKYPPPATSPAPAAPLPTSSRAPTGGPRP